MNRKYVWIGIAVLVSLCLISVGSAAQTTLAEGDVELAVSGLVEAPINYTTTEEQKNLVCKIDYTLRNRVYDKYYVHKGILNNRTDKDYDAIPDVVIQSIEFRKADLTKVGTGTLKVWKVGIADAANKLMYVDYEFVLNIDQTWQSGISSDELLHIYEGGYVSGGADFTNLGEYYGHTTPAQYFKWGRSSDSYMSVNDFTDAYGICIGSIGVIRVLGSNSPYEQTDISYQSQFYNEYEVIADDDGFRQVEITRVCSECSGKSTNSRVWVLDKDGELIFYSSYQSEVNSTHQFPAQPVAVWLIAANMADDGNDFPVKIYDDTTHPTYCCVKGYTYNAETGAVLTGVSASLDGFSDTSDGDGFYFIGPVLAEQDYTLTGSKSGYYDRVYDLHLAYAQDYLIDLPLIPETHTHTGHGILGLVTTLPYHGICENHTVSIENSTWSDTTTTNSVGYYEFDNLEVDDYWINVSKDAYRDNNQSVTVSATGDEIVTIDNCDATTNWASDNSLTLNTTDKQEGTGSLQSSGSSTLDFNKSAPTAIDASNVTKSNGYMTFWYKVNDTTRITDYLVFTVGSNGDNSTHKISWSVYKSNFVNDTWKEVWLKFSDGAETGTLNISNINWLEVKAAKSDSVISKIDDIRFYDFSYEIHNVDLDPILSLGVIAKTLDENIIDSFFATLDGTTKNTTTGQEIIFSDLSYGMKELTVTSEGYIPYQKSIYLDSNTNITAYMQEGAEGGAGVYYPPPHLVEFRVQNMWGKAYPNALVTAQGYSTTMGSWDWLYSIFGYKNETQIHNTTMSDTTDDDGQLSFLMVETIKYRIDVSDTESPARFENKTFWKAPSDKHYNLVVSEGWTWQKAGTEEQKEMSINVTTLIINSTHAYINVSYNDPSNKTTDLTIYVNQTINNNEEECLNSSNWVDTSVQNYSYTVTPYKGRAYKIQVVTEHEEWGSRTWTYAKRFEGMLIDLGLPDVAYPMIAVALLLFTGGIWGRSSATQGALVMCFEGWVFYAIGFLTMIPTATILSALALASVVSIIAIMMEKSRRTGVQ